MTEKFLDTYQEEVYKVLHIVCYLFLATRQNQTQNLVFRATKRRKETMTMPAKKAAKKAAKPAKKAAKKAAKKK